MHENVSVNAQASTSRPDLLQVCVPYRFSIHLKPLEKPPILILELKANHTSGLITGEVNEVYLAFSPGQE